MSYIGLVLAIAFGWWVGTMIAQTDSILLLFVGMIIAGGGAYILQTIALRLHIP